MRISGTHQIADKPSQRWNELFKREKLFGEKKLVRKFVDRVLHRRECTKCNKVKSSMPSHVHLMQVALKKIFLPLKQSIGDLYKPNKCVLLVQRYTAIKDWTHWPRFTATTCRNVLCRPLTIVQTVGVLYVSRLYLVKPCTVHRPSYGISHVSCTITLNGQM